MKINGSILKWQVRLENRGGSGNGRKLKITVVQWFCLFKIRLIQFPSTEIFCPEQTRLSGWPVGQVVAGGWIPAHANNNNNNNNCGPKSAHPSSLELQIDRARSVQVWRSTVLTNQPSNPCLDGAKFRIALTSSWNQLEDSANAIATASGASVTGNNTISSVSATGWLNSHGQSICVGSF